MTIFNQSSVSSNQNDGPKPWHISAETIDGRVVAIADLGDFVSTKFKDEKGAPKVARKIALLFAVNELGEDGLHKTITSPPLSASTFKPSATGRGKASKICDMFAKAGIDVANKPLSSLLGACARLVIADQPNGYQSVDIMGPVRAKNFNPAAPIYVPKFWLDREVDGQLLKGKAVEILCEPSVLKEVKPEAEDVSIPLGDTAADINVEDIADSV